jgi:hypothetical protein
MRLSFRILALAAAVSAASCGDVSRTGRSPVQMVISKLSAAAGNDPTKLVANLGSDVITNGTVFNDVGSADIFLQAKNPTIAPSGLNAVTITRIHVEYVRADGHNVQGVDVPYAWDGAVTGTIAPGGSSTTLGFEIVRIVAKEESPLVQLRTSSNFITTICNVTFYGQDLSGNEISVTGSIQINFGNFGDPGA